MVLVISMKMRLVWPFGQFSNAARNRMLIVTLILSAILLIAMHVLDKPLRTRYAPRGIVSFELAKNYEHSRQILNSWDAKAKTHAALSLGLDYLFLIFYAILIALACIQVANALQAQKSFLAGIGPILARAQFLAATLDALENLALIQLLLDSSRTWLPGLARWCAIVKFGIVGAGLSYIISGLFIIGLRKIFADSV